MNYISILFVALGGALGSVLRYILGIYLNQKLPLGTFLVNILGSFLIGILFGLYSQQSIDKKSFLLLAVGFCGGFTTFSTFAYENYKFIQEGNFTSFILYSGASLLISLVMIYFGLILSNFSLK